MTVAMIAVMCAVYVYEQALPPGGILHVARLAGMVPWEISHLRDLVNQTQPRDLVPPPLTIYTSLFLHGDILHIAGNVWMLWLFGSRLEGLLGAARYLGLLLVTATAAALLQVWASPNSTMPMIGASGAIAGVLGAYAVTLPRARVRCLALVFLFVTPIRLPALVLLVLWFLVQLALAGFHNPHAPPNVAWYAHIGGFVVGALLARTAMLRPRPAPARLETVPA